MGIVYFISLILLGYSVSFNQVEGLRAENILNGQTGTALRFRYAVAVIYQFNQTHIENPCAGAIINSLYIATVAHCFFHKEHGTYINKQFFIVISTTDVHTPRYSTRQIQVKFVIMPDTYESSQLRTYNAKGDLAIVMMAESLGPITENHPILKELSIPGRQFKPLNKQFYVSGFGWHEFIESSSSTARQGRTDGKLRFGTAAVISDDECRNILQTDLAPGNMCARILRTEKNLPTGLCSGDSGGPLVYQHLLKGIAISGLRSCDETELPGIYINTTYYKQFIHDASIGRITGEMKVVELKEIILNQYMFVEFRGSELP